MPFPATLTVAAPDSQGLLCPVCAGIFILFSSCRISIGLIQPFQSWKRGATVSKLFVEIPPSTPLTNTTLTSSSPWQHQHSTVLLSTPTNTHIPPFLLRTMEPVKSHRWCYQNTGASPVSQQNCWTLGPS